MKQNLPDLIHIDPSLSVPIYKQIVQSITKGIDNGLLDQNDKLPSVNSIAERFQLARGSVFTAYNELRASGIIDSIPGKGYFITSTQTNAIQNVFLLLDSFNTYTGILYNSILEHLPVGSRLDIFFHHHDTKLFENIIREQAARYNYFIILPLVYEKTITILSALDPRQVFLLETGYKEYKKHYTGVFQNLEKDIFAVLVKITQHVSRYRRLFLVIPRHKTTKEIVAGFNRFARSYKIESSVLYDIDVKDLRKGDAFIILDDQHLVELIRCAKTIGLVAGKDIGFISYNENDLKTVVGDGISTISPDYAAMGKSVARMLLSTDRKAVENPFVLVDRNSF